MSVGTYPSKLALFQPVKVEGSILKEHFVEFRPTGQFNKGSCVEFTIPGTSASYIDLRKTRLHIKVAIKKEDGSLVGKDDLVGLVNLSLHSLFRQVDIALNQTVITAGVGVNYCFKSILDVLLHYGHDVKESELQSELYYKDTAGSMEATDPVSGGNAGLFERFLLSRDTGLVTMEGPIHMDICQQRKNIINGVPINVKLYPFD